MCKVGKNLYQKSQFDQYSGLISKRFHLHNLHYPNHRLQGLIKFTVFYQWGQQWSSKLFLKNKRINQCQKKLVLECLPSKHEVLGSVPSTNGKRQEKRILNFHQHHKRSQCGCLKVHPAWIEAVATRGLVSHRSSHGKEKEQSLRSPSLASVSSNSAVTSCPGLLVYIPISQLLLI